MTRMFPVMKSIKGPGIEISSEKNKEEKQIIAVSAGGVLLEQICLGSSSNWSISAPGVLAGVCWDFDWSGSPRQTSVSQKFCIKQNNGLTDISSSRHIHMQTSSSDGGVITADVDWYKMWSRTKISNDMPSSPASRTAITWIIVYDVRISM